MAVLIAACLMAALLPAGNALSCQTCQNRTGLLCKGTVTVCASVFDTCTGVYAETTEGGKFIAGNYQIRCGESKSCNSMYSVTTGSLSIKSGTSCCKQDGCTPQIPSGATQNGLECPACVGASPDSCDSGMNTMKCTGLENQCVRYTLSSSASTMTILRGCSTEAFCAYGNFSSSMADVTTVCTNGAT
ncbi:phospholipase A2 inhibitor and Ly6/PLAUR domain-containing protein-like [Ambystoma mexicanum]|uniref:phospholipase A2 inhibitor and Ly6/PLAUR domain-containing protein-like n=1 Tax=Ambystoma mexicanum TaxID=8296 RepID=UPI0037E8D24B